MLAWSGVVVLHTLMLFHGVLWVESTNQTATPFEPPPTNTTAGTNSTSANDGGNNTENKIVTTNAASGYEVESTTQTTTPEPTTITEMSSTTDYVESTTQVNTTAGINSTAAYGGGNATEHGNGTIHGASKYAAISGQRSFRNETVKENRIIGGQEAHSNSWPWQVSLLFANMPSCGGAIINEHYVLTAAHCFKRFKKARFWKVKAGKHDLSLVESTEQAVGVAEILSHADYNRRTKANDIALVRLQEKLTFNQYVRPIDVWLKPLDPPLRCAITGWGATSERSPRVHRLQEVNVTCIDRDTCNRFYRGKVKRNMFCAGDPEGGVDACQGDSGGPLSCFTGTRWLLGGLISWGVGCGRKRKPGVYTRLQDYVEWINGQLVDSTASGAGFDHAATCGVAQAARPVLAAQFVRDRRMQWRLKGVTSARLGWSWQVSLQTTADDHNDCSGTLIHKDWVLASRHCDVRAWWTVAVLGIHDLNEMAIQSVLVDDVRLLPEGDDRSPGLALLHLSSSAQIGAAGSAIFPVCLPGHGVQLDDSWSCVTTGWGRVRAAEDSPVDADILHQTLLSLVDQAACRSCWSDNPRFQDTDLCTNAAGSASCMGDAGAPLFCQKNGVYYLFGLFSFGNRCNPDRPAVFTSISAHLKWIQDIISQ